MQLFILSCLLIMMHTTIWYASNLQLIIKNQTYALLWAVIIGIPANILVFYVTKLGHAQFQSLWTVRLLAFGASYFVFPVMTYFYLDESPFNPKTMTCIFLSFVIMAIQIFWKNT